MILQGNGWQITVVKIDYGPAPSYDLAKWLAKEISRLFEIPVADVEVTTEVTHSIMRYITRVPLTDERPAIKFTDIREDFETRSPDALGRSIYAKLVF